MDLTLMRAIAAAWSGPDALVEIIESYAIFTRHETAMFNWLEDATRDGESGVSICGVCIGWTSREESKHWFDRRYTMTWKGRTSRLVLFSQLLNGEWVGAFRNQEGISAAYNNYWGILEEILSAHTPKNYARLKAWRAMARVKNERKPDI
jgi:hypothetical protein